MSDFKYIMFDFDGTLANSQLYWQTVVLRILESRGCPATEEDYAYCLDHPMQERWDRFRTAWNLSEEDRPSPEEVFEWIDRHYCTDLAWKPGAEEYLKTMKERGIVTCIFSATPLYILRHGIERLGAAPYVDYVFSSHDLGIGKDKPASYLWCLEQLGAKPEETVMVEDALYSIKTAKEVGLQVFGIYERCSRIREEQIRSLSDRYVKDFYELLQ